MRILNLHIQLPSYDNLCENTLVGPISLKYSNNNKLILNYNCVGCGKFET